MYNMKEWYFDLKLEVEYKLAEIREECKENGEEINHTLISESLYDDTLYLKYCDNSTDLTILLVEIRRSQEDFHIYKLVN
jgi:hypothetical protein